MRVVHGPMHDRGFACMLGPKRAPKRSLQCLRPKTIWNHFSICACHPCCGDIMLIFSVSFQVYQMYNTFGLNGMDVEVAV